MRGRSSGVEHRTLNPECVGSEPTAPTINFQFGPSNSALFVASVSRWFGSSVGSGEKMGSIPSRRPPFLLSKKLHHYPLARQPTARQLMLATVTIYVAQCALQYTIYCGVQGATSQVKYCLFFSYFIGDRLWYKVLQSANLVQPVNNHQGKSFVTG